LPEIKNRTLEEIDEMFEAKPELSARKFRKYVCTGRYVADEKVLAEAEKDGVERREDVSA
jgi:SP family sugar:H+ symporter-like MFS transporter